MEKVDSPQYLFFKHIKDHLPAHLSLVDEIAEILHVSNDSAYRRIRCDKPVSFEEVAILCIHYKISLDQFLHLNSKSIIFTGLPEASAEDDFLQYLKTFLTNIKYIHSYQKKHLFYLAKDVPSLTYFQLPELASFKFFVWRRSVLFDPSLKRKKFSLQTDDSKYHQISKQIIKLYLQIPGTEIWNLDAVTITLQQLNFYRESDLFESSADYMLVLDQYLALINHIEIQAESGKKFLIGEQPADDAVQFNLFYNELALGDNTVLAELDDLKVTFLNHSVIHFISTTDKKFNDHTYASIMNLISKSTQISGTGEKERTKFFNSLRNDIAKLRM